MDHESMLTTFDNPFDYFTQFNEWFMFDIEKQYYTCSLLGRIVAPLLFEGMTQKEENAAIEQAIDEIIKYDFMNMYKKIQRESTPEH